ncbi:MotA/TolQ/ExbB proton channel family protein [Spirochaeta isovalerica]|uniref:Biopolymer transport protein ExbB n=1 Tax=Spirochaeta isovalerica TaxID=150 RepID=A0A841RHJ0_9SPIO|nr:MotA/TolQ/ExbB proton channel family protein [Spirochaeta isovalerica]MBB6482239.1 biopolymer transport protein ExbB [Spirochaeta isovalerica]
MLDILMKGGVILWIILLLSLVGAAIIIERLLYFRKTRVDEDKLFNRIKATVEKKHFDEAIFICESTVSPFTRLMKTGIEHRNYPKHVQKEVLQEAANQEIPHLERSLSFLGTIAHISPLLGLLGTVTGNIQAFGVLGSFGAVSDPSVLARGISEALITTAGGIIVSIPAVIFYNYLVDKVGKILIKMESQVNDMLILLNEEETVEPEPRSGE